MSTLIDSLTTLAAPSVRQIATRLGENDASVSRGLRTSLACVLAGLVTRTKDPTSIRQIFDLFAGRTANANVGLDLEGMVASLSPTAPTTGTAGRLLNTLFGGRTAAVGDLVTRSVGFRNASSGAALLGLSTPMVLGFLGNKVRDSALSPAGLSNLLLDERESVLAAAPPGLVDLVDTGGISISTYRETPRVATPIVARPPHNNHHASSNRWAWPVVGVAAAALIWFVVERGRTPVMGPLAGTSASVIDSAAGTSDITQAGGALGAFTRRRLPNGVEISIPEHGTESKLLAFIEDRNRAVNDTTWFDFDRVTFATASANILPESKDQLNNIVQVMKAYPHVSLKVGGYTDNIGSSAANARLSERRANAVRQALIEEGVPASRLQAEGYGEKHPVADNATEEGRARNRRIALRVTKK